MSGVDVGGAAAAWGGSPPAAGAGPATAAAGPWVGPPIEGGAGPARTSAAAAADATRPWQWPVNAPVLVTAEFVAPATRYGAGHRGADLATAPGAPVLAPRDGVVAFAGAVAGRPVVSIDHPGDYRSSVEPVVATVAVGDVVLHGQVIGTVGTGGHCAAVCLHFGVRLHGDYLNPRGLVGEIPRAILLPRLAALPGAGPQSSRGEVVGRDGAVAAAGRSPPRCRTGRARGRARP
ncbi:murein hydrolase activator EnvC family protein [Herbiconiux ginsengi]|uniref:murein hydrolase activator EnvC family protein n=1 Tax=Herbiconiux ginsengi TaxID=381665 RepID=UPI0015879EB3|nr:M23 family metallopeptidase [Herbiconiux ginsengi]